MIWQELEDKLAALDREQLRRRRRIVDSSCGTRLTVDGRELLAFCSNDYLGLANEAQIVEALCDGARRWGAGSGAAHAISGHLRPHQQLEEALAQFVGLPRALLFSTGFMANLGIVPALVGRGDAVFADRLNHASLIDAALASGAEHKRYAHKDVAALQKLLAQSTAKHKLILTDAVFSMDGDIAPLDKLFVLAEEHDAWLVIDDAHGFGVLGQQGRGSLSHFNLPQSPRIVYMGTLGKAAGVAGAFVAGDANVIEWLQQRSRTAIFTTAHPPAISCALLTSLELIAAGDARRQNLFARIAQLRSELAPLAAQRGWQLAESQMPIQPLIVGSNQSALDLSAALEAQGIWVPAIRPPTVPQGSARLRICLSAAHSEADVTALVAALEKCHECHLPGRPMDDATTKPMEQAHPANNHHHSMPSEGGRAEGTQKSLAVHSNGDGPNLTLVHGWGLGSGVLGNIAQALGEHFTVNRVDLPGYGDSPPIDAAGIDAVADALAATLPPRAMLCGWSLGAMVCLACAARHPRLVARMVLVGATASFVAREGWAEAMPVAQLDEFRDALTADSAQLLKRFASLIHQGAAQPREAQRYLGTVDASVAGGAALQASLDLLAQTDLRALLDTVPQPVLLVHGDTDPLMPLAAAERLLLQLPDARLEVYGGSAHAPFASDPARFVDSVLRFAGMLE